MIGSNAVTKSMLGTKAIRVDPDTGMPECGVVLERTLWRKLQTLPVNQQALVLAGVWGRINFTSRRHLMSANERAAQDIFLSAVDLAIEFVERGAGGAIGEICSVVIGQNKT